MEWNVYRYDINMKKISQWNIFEHSAFLSDIKKLLHKNLNKNEFKKELKNDLFYYFWSKSEYEILLKPWIGDDEEKKIDVYQQVMLNFPNFADYLWEKKEGGRYCE